MSLREVPVLCQLCGEHLPTPDAAWDHDCPEWERVVRTNLPTLAAHRNILKLYDKKPEGWQKRLIRFGIKLACGEEADLLDALLRMRRGYAYRFSRKIVKRGLVVDDLEEKRLQRLRKRAEEEEEPF